MEMENQEEVWDNIGRDWRVMRTTPVKEAIDFLKAKKGNVLDLACGSGRNFCRINGTIYAVDFSKKMLEYSEKYAKEANIKIKTKKASADNLPFEDNFFDAAIFIAGLHCIESDDKRKKSLMELHRVLKSGAEALITVWDKNQPKFRKLKQKEIKLAWNVDGKKFMRYYYLYDKEELMFLLKEVGFRILKIIDKENSDGFYSKRNIIFIVRKI